MRLALGASSPSSYLFPLFCNDLLPRGSACQVKEFGNPGHLNKGRMLMGFLGGDLGGSEDLLGIEKGG